MKHRVKNTLRELARHFGLKVKYVDYFDDQTHGKLLVRERRILINARKPRSEHVYTLLHEVGHFLLHVLQPHRKYHPWYFDIQWKINRLARAFSKIRRYIRYYHNTESGKEWQADLWALCAFWLLAKDFGAKSELAAFLQRHPEKIPALLLVRGAVSYQNLKTNGTKVLKWVRPTGKTV